MNLTLYGNGSSGNHGCEAIVRGTVAALGREKNVFTVLCDNIGQDKQYGLGELAKLLPAETLVRKDARFLLAYAKLKLHGDYAAMDLLPYLQRIREQRRTTEVALSVGGDNYCYGGTEIYRYLNKSYHANGIPTVLWGCSIEPEVVKQEKVREDLLRYDLVVARESITFDAVRKVQPHTLLAPDPAFCMEPLPCKADDRFLNENVVGVNISPMIVSNENVPGMARANYEEFVRFLLEETDCTVALIPHVVWPQSDDRKELLRLYEKFAQKDRMILVDDHTAPELKYMIGKCRFFVGARTHATIAAYSSCVPTLVVGYSVKARGIATDLLGTENGYVLPVQSLNSSRELRDSFIRLFEQEKEIRTHLETVMPSYVESIRAASDAINPFGKN